MKQIINAIAVNDSAIPATSRYWQEQMAASGEPETNIRAFPSKVTPVFNWSKPRLLD